MKPDIHLLYTELTFKTSRSGGSGGQIVTGSFTSIPSYIMDINVGDGGVGGTYIGPSEPYSNGYAGSNGNKSYITYNSKTYKATGGYGGAGGYGYNGYAPGGKSAGNGTIATSVGQSGSDGGGGVGGGWNDGTPEVTAGNGGVSSVSVYYFNTDFGAGSGGASLGNSTGNHGTSGNEYAGQTGYTYSPFNNTSVLPTNGKANYGGGGGAGAVGGNGTTAGSGTGGDGGVGGWRCGVWCAGMGTCACAANGGRA
jgi:hypothetical protein